MGLFLEINFFFLNFLKNWVGIFSSYLISYLLHPILLISCSWQYKNNIINNWKSGTAFEEALISCI